MTPLRTILQIVCASAALCCCEPSAAVQMAAAARAGEAYLVVHRKSGDAIEVLAAPAFAEANDVVQLGYVAAGQRFGAIVSIDGTGAVTLHFPVSSSARGELLPSAHRAHRAGSPRAIAPRSPALAFVPAAFELDDAPHFERFFFVTAQTPIDVERVLSASYALGRHVETVEFGRLDLDPTWAQSSFLIRKPGHPRAAIGRNAQEPAP